MEYVLNPSTNRTPPGYTLAGSPRPKITRMNDLILAPAKPRARAVMLKQPACRQAGGDMLRDSDVPVDLAQAGPIPGITIECGL